MKYLASIIVLACLIGCATIDPTADKLVVRVEQTQTAAMASFDFVLHMDHSNRSSWATNAPGFHAFAEWLRTPQAYGTQSVSRCVAMQLNVDDLKMAYKASKSTGTSNALWSAWSVLNASFMQAGSWSNIITSPIHP